MNDRVTFQFPDASFPGQLINGVVYLSLDSLCNWLTELAETLDEVNSHEAARDVTRGIRDTLRRGMVRPG